MTDHKQIVTAIAAALCSSLTERASDQVDIRARERFDHYGCGGSKGE
jgi:hypothetical protein